MNSTKKNSEFGGVKKKLTAAIAMLLVATIMMVSSTYAWFTLSTAPEVTGITTSVGANGNLEMALLTKDTYNHTDAITSTVGDSSAAQEVTKANITWGNLVDLSDASYGLNNIKLLPSRLLAKNGTIANLTAAIAVADYGNDGRVTALNDGTVSGIYQKKGDSDATMIFKVSDNEYGVRALGTASGMSQQQLAYRNAQGYMATYTAQAKTYAQQSLNLYGSQLANIAVQHATASGETDTTTYTKADAEAINGMLDQLTLSKKALEKALMYTVLAKVASKEGSADKYAAVKAAVEASDATLEKVEQAATTAFVPSDTNGYVGAKNAWNAMTIPAKIDTITKVSFEWSDMQAAVDGLMDTRKLKLNGIAVNEIKQGDNISTIVNSVLGGNGLTLTMDPDSGIYDYVAKACGNFSANVTIKEISYGNISAKNVKATMTTGSNVSPAYMVKALTYAVGYGAPEQAAGEVKAITDTYAYAIDLAFRTNAANANLQLQTEAAQRIYDGSTVQDTQGAGSNFTFTLGANFTEATAKALAGCIYVVFVDDTGTVVGTAGLDTSERGWTPSGSGYKANLIMKTATFDANGKITVGAAAQTSTITALPQNQAKVLTAYVYLNGDQVDNSMVAANGAVSMVGSLNLQFSTDQTLTPMDYTPLQQSGSTSTNGQGN